MRRATCVVDGCGIFVIGDAVVSHEGRKGRGGEEATTPLLVSARREVGDREGEVDLRSQAASRPHGDDPPEEAA
jgi:hypothetical protein